jgi:hypothetical protein
MTDEQTDGVTEATFIKGTGFSAGEYPEAFAKPYCEASGLSFDRVLVDRGG